METLDRDRLKQLLVRNWMTHDAMWLVEAIRAVGIEDANRMNRAAVRGMARVEAKRLVRALGADGVRDLDGLRAFIDLARDTVIGDFMAFEWEWLPAEQALRIGTDRCFALEGVTGLGVADRYECGIFERIFGWLEALEVGYEVEPDVLRCTLFHDGVCRRTIRFDFARAP